MKFYPRNALLVVCFFLGVGVLISPLAAAEFSDWSLPVNLGPVVNSQFEDFAPQISKDGLSLYFTSTRSPGSLGGEDLWVSQRGREDDAWEPPINLGPAINTPSNERSPGFSRDGHFLFFATDRAGGAGGFDIWVSWRAHTHDNFGWQAPVPVTAVNSASTDAGPSLLENGEAGLPQLFLASNRPGGSGSLDIYLSTLSATGFGPPVPVVGINTSAMDLTPYIRHDGLEIIIASTRPGGVGAQDLWASTRESVFAAWSAPVNLGPLVNSEFNDGFPSLSSDGRTLFFQSSRSSGFGGADLYMSSRARKSNRYNH